MNKNSLSKILGKKGLTGDELGRLAILNNVAILQNYHEGKEGKPLFDEEEINRTAKDLTDYQKQVYGRYLDLYGVINHYFNIGNAMYQQAMNGIHRLMFRATLLLNHIQAEIQKRELPLIITEEKYKELKASADAEAFSFEESYIDLFIEALWYYIDQIEANPEAENIITPLLKKHEGKPIKDNFLIETYIIDNHDNYFYNNNCFYKLQTGQSSEGVTMKEYIDDFLSRPIFKKLSTEGINTIKHNIKTRFKGMLRILQNNDINDIPEDLRGFIKDRVALSNKASAIRITEMIDIIKSYLLGVEDKELIDAIEELQQDLIIIPKEERPTQADIIRYYGFLIAPYKDASANIKVFKNYIEELPDIAEVIHNDLISHAVIKKAIKGLPIEELYSDKKIINWKALFDADAYDYKQRVDAIFRDNNPKARQGVAIIKEGTIPENLIKNGIFEPHIQAFSSDKLTSADISIEELKDFKKSIRKIIDNLLIPATKNVCAINYFYRDIEELYNIEGLEDAYGQSTEDITDKIKTINFMADMIKQSLYHLYRGTDEGLLKEEYITEAFSYIDMEDILPDAEQQAKAKEVLADIKNFKGKDYSPKFMYLYVKGSPDTLQVVNKPEDY